MEGGFGVQILFYWTDFICEHSDFVNEWCYPSDPFIRVGPDEL